MAELEVGCWLPIRPPSRWEWQFTCDVCGYISMDPDSVAAHLVGKCAILSEVKEYWWPDSDDWTTP
jgi:hypothetical protein